MTRPQNLLRRSLSYAALLALNACAGTAATSSEPPSTAAAPERAREDARAQIAENADDLDAWFRFGLAWQQMAEASGSARPVLQDSARVAFEEVLSRDPDNVRALVHHGLTLEDLGKAEEARVQYRRATELAPGDPLPLINLGNLLYFHFRDTYEAKEALTRALELDPDNPDAHFNLGVLFADASLFEEARLEWERVIELNAEGPARKLAEENLARIRPILTPEGDAAE